MKRNLLKICACAVAIILTMTVFSACSDEGNSEELQGNKFDSNISMVQGGHPELIPDITYKDAYEHFFANPEWRGFKADDGSEVVEFSGECTYYDDPATVYIQFVIDDEESFSMWYVSFDVNGEKLTANKQEFIELVYTPFATYSEEVLGEELSEDVQMQFAEYYKSLEG